MIYDKYKELVRHLRPTEFSYNESMKKHTSFKIGGPAELFVVPESKSRLVKIIKLCRASGISPYIIGNGSNLLISDLGIKGVVIQISRNINAVKIEGNFVSAEAGILLSTLAKRIYENGLTGFEFAAGIPGTLGGAVYMNAGAYGGEMKDVLTSVNAIDYEGNIKSLRKDKLELGYRSSILNKEHLIAIEANMELVHCDQQTIKALMDELAYKRRSKQPLDMASAGSTFKRPEGYYAGKLIMDSGLMGKSIGGAEVSLKHAGFIVNKGDATCKDVLDLMAFVKETVFKKYGVELEAEVRKLGI